MKAARRDPLAGWRAWRAQMEAAESAATASGQNDNAPTEPEAIDLGTLPDHPCQACAGRLFWRAADPSARARAVELWVCQRCEPPDPDQWRDATCLPVRQNHQC